MAQGTDARPDGSGKDLRAKIDCSGLLAREVLLQVIPLCLRAREQKSRAKVVVQNLERLSDSVTRLLKAFDRLAEDFPAEITLADGSGFASAFIDALSGRARLDLEQGKAE
jgi:hypothetical protein